MGVVWRCLTSRVGFAFAGGVVSCAGAPGKVLVPGGGSDDLLSSAEPDVETQEQPEESQVMPGINFELLSFTDQMCDEMM